MSFQVGDTVGDYQIIGILGAGGMGKVYKVKNVISERVDAMKVLLPNLADDQDLADRFIREIKVLASLNHPNIAGLRTAFRLENQLLMVMEFVEGTSLDERCKQGKIPVQEAINYTTQALAALGYAHKHGVIHRDIKPANMMLTPDGIVKLMDFGIAKSKSDKKLTQTGTTMGSLFYMSAEQVQGNELDGRSDLYSIGVSLYEMVTGTRPFQGKSDFDIMIAQLQQTPQQPMMMMPELPKALNDIIMISLEKDPAKRFQTAEAFSAALASIGNALNATPVQASYGAAPGAGGTAVGVQIPSSTAMMSPPPATATAPSVAVGGAPAAGYTPTANVPTVMAPQPQPAPVAAPAQPAPYTAQPSAASKGYRGLYMALGALIVVAVLAAAAIQVPRFLKTHAGTDQTNQSAQKNAAPATPAATSTTSSAPAQPGGQAPGGTSNPGVNQTATTAGAGSGGGLATPNGASPPPGTGANTANTAPPAAGTVVSGKPFKAGSAPLNGAAGGQLSSTPPAGAGSQTPQTPPAAAGQASPPNANAQELAELSDLHDKLANRAGAVNDRVENMRREMGPNNLNSVISSAQARLNMNMANFDKAMSAGDAAAARKSMNLAEHDIEFLEQKFNIQ